MSVRQVLDAAHGALLGAIVAFLAFLAVTSRRPKSRSLRPAAACAVATGLLLVVSVVDLPRRVMLLVLVVGLGLVAFGFGQLVQQLPAQSTASPADIRRTQRDARAVWAVLAIATLGAAILALRIA